MATLREYFEGAFGGYAKFVRQVESAANGVVNCQAEARLYVAFDEYVCFLSFYVAPEFANAECLQGLIMQHQAIIDLMRNSSTISGGHIVYETTPVSSNDLPFTGRIILWVDALLSEASKQTLIAVAASQSLHLQIRDRSYQDFVNSFERPLGFISHDSRDKADFVEPLATKLRSALCPVWYDEFALQPGMSIRESIDRGLQESRRCVIVLSPNFLSNPTWGKAEFNAAVSKHIYAGGDVIIPIWHGVTREQVAEYSPLISDIFAINSNVGMDEVFRQLRTALMRP